MYHFLLDVWFTGLIYLIFFLQYWKKTRVWEWYIQCSWKWKIWRAHVGVGVYARVRMSVRMYVVLIIIIHFRLSVAKMFCKCPSNWTWVVRSQGSMTFLDLELAIVHSGGPSTSYSVNERNWYATKWRTDARWCEHTRMDQTRHTHRAQVYACTYINVYKFMWMYVYTYICLRRETHTDNTDKCW